MLALAKPVARRLGALTVVAAAVLGVAMAQGQDTQGSAQPCAAVCLARALIANIPADERVGLVDFGAPGTAIPREIADDLYDRIARALSQASRGRHHFTNKSRNDKAWESWQAERETSDYLAFWNRRRVGVTVHCEDRGLKGPGIALSCAAFPVGKDSRLKGDIQGPLAVLPVKRPLFEYEYTLTRLGLDLAERREPGKIDRVRITGPDGERSALTEHMERTLRRVVEDRFRERRGALQRQANFRETITGQSAKASAPSADHELRGGLTWMTGALANLSVSLWRSGERVTTLEGLFERAWLPPNLVRSDAGRMRYRATARAVASDRLGDASARRAVRNLARARVVAQALGRKPPDIAEIRSERDGVQALHGTLDHGIPTGERFDGPVKDDSGVWRVELDARVVEVGSKVRPEFHAGLARDELRAMADIVIELSAQEQVHVGVFAWGADNKVVRLYPGAGAGGLTVPAGGRVVLPRTGEHRIRSAPLPGNEIDHEAIIVVAAGERLAFRDLAPQAGGSVAATMKAAVSAGAFFERLARLNLSRAAVAVLPYQVARK